MTEHIGLNRGWEFTERFDDAFLAGEPVPGVCAVELPHTCRETPYHYFDEKIYQMVCGYRRRLAVPQAWAGKRVFLNLGAAGHAAEVFVDGRKLGAHHDGYTAFRVELTEALVPGAEALLTVKVDSRETLDQPPFGYVIDYMTYGGLYREAALEIRDQSFLADVFARPALPGAVSSTVWLDGALREGFRLRQQVLDKEGAPLSDYSFDATGAVTETTFSVPGAAAWDTEHPVLYTLVTELMENGTVLDRMETRIGFRKVEWKTDGFYLNGKKTKLVGMDRHQSYPYVGYAMPASMQRLDADILKYELGLNAVRTSHYPQSQHFVDRCDEIGLLVFTEIPGWQHIGGEAWKDQAVENVREMVTQYRNHPSIILWGVRINESKDDDAFYARTNALARTLDPSRATGGVRCIKKSKLLEDVYTYNDFIHDGKSPGCDKKKAVTSDPEKPYLISEYCGHMFPTKTCDSEEHRLEHALRHATVLDAVAGEADIAGSFGWCMFDYNTHKDFGSGDRICYHGVTDMFRNPKLAAAVYAARQDAIPVLEVSSTMDIGEHPAGNRGRVFVMTNADEVRFYRNDVFIRTYTHANSPYHNLYRPPIEIDDFLGDQLVENEGFSPKQAELVKDILNYSARFGSAHLPPTIMAKAGLLMTRYRMSFDDAYALYGKYIGDWGGATTVYRFEAVKNGKVVKTVLKAPVESMQLSVTVDHTALREAETWDAAALRIAMTDQNGNVLPFYQGAVALDAEGPIAVIGPAAAQLRGGLGGSYVRTVGTPGEAVLTLTAEGAAPVTVRFTIECEQEKGAI